MVVLLISSVLFGACTKGSTTVSSAQHSARDTQTPTASSFVFGTIPVYPGAKLEMSDDHKTAMLYTNATTGDAYTFYQNELKKQHWNIETAGADQTPAVIVASDGVRDLLINIRKEEQGAAINIATMPRGQARHYVSH